MKPSRRILRTAFDNGITHFDLANNYGPPYGEAERNFGVHMLRDWKPHRDELVISTKAGYDMWPGPYGNWGSRKYLISSLDQSLRRMNLDYVDIFYHHRPDPETPIEETDGRARSDRAQRQGALRRHFATTRREQTEVAIRTLRELGTPMLIHQENYSMLNRKIEAGLTDVLTREGVGLMAFGPLAGGRLTGRTSGRYSGGQPHRPRPALSESGDAHAGAARGDRRADQDRRRARGDALPVGAAMGAARQSRDLGTHRREPRGADSTENVAALSLPPLTGEELAQIDAALALNE